MVLIIMVLIEVFITINCVTDVILLYHYPKYAIVFGPTRVTWYVQIITVDRCSDQHDRATWSAGRHPTHSWL